MAQQALSMSSVEERIRKIADASDMLMCDGYETARLAVLMTATEETRRCETLAQLMHEIQSEIDALRSRRSSLRAELAQELVRIGVVLIRPVPAGDTAKVQQEV